MENKVDIKKINEKIEKESAFIDLLRSEMNKVIVGQKNMVDKLLIGLLAKGHILLEGVPPHLFSRTRDLLDEFADVLSEFDA